MAFLLYIYIFISVVLGIAALVRGEVAIGIVGILGPNLCWFAGSGIRGSLMVGTRLQIVTGFILGVVCISISLYLAYYFEFKLKFFGYIIPGTW